MDKETELSLIAQVYRDMLNVLCLKHPLSEKVEERFTQIIGAIIERQQKVIDASKNMNLFSWKIKGSDMIILAINYETKEITIGYKEIQKLKKGDKNGKAKSNRIVRANKYRVEK
jgi:hypothetical protein